MSSLAEKIKQSRQRQIEVGGFSFLIIRPTDLQINELTDYRQSTIMSHFVIGWDDVKESDLIEGGSADKVAFSSDLFMAWVGDKPDLWRGITEAISSDYNSRKKQLEDGGKKPETG